MKSYLLERSHSNGNSSFIVFLFIFINDLLRIFILSGFCYSPFREQHAVKDIRFEDAKV